MNAFLPALHTHTQRMAVLSARLAPHLTPGAWERLVQQPGAQTIAFRQKTLTVVFVESGALHSWRQSSQDFFVAQVARLAAQHYGTIDEFGRIGTVVFFEDAQDAVRMAMGLQRHTGDLGLRMGVHTCVCDMASFHSGGRSYCTLIGPETSLAANVAATATRGSIVISPEAYALVHSLVYCDMQSCLLTEEFDDSDMATASLTHMPASPINASSLCGGLEMS